MKTHHLLVTVLAFAGSTLTAWGQAVEPPVPVRTVAPAYPAALKRDGTTGIVTLSIMIDEKGAVQDPKVIKATNDAFAQPALDAIAKWKFKPAQRDGAPVPIRVNIPIKFTIED
jgi:protein TonB